MLVFRPLTQGHESGTLRMASTENKNVFSGVGSDQDLESSPEKWNSSKAWVRQDSQTQR